MGAARTITSDVFRTEIQNGKGVAVLDFGAVWCGPCQKLAPAIDRMAADYAGRAIIGKVDVDQEQDLAVRFDVVSVPTIIFFKDGQKVDEFRSGANPDRIREKLDGLLRASAASS